MAEIVNLRTVRKRKKRDEKETIATHNRARFGRPKTEQAKSEAQQTLDDAKLDGHLRDDSE